MTNTVVLAVGVGCGICVGLLIRPRLLRLLWGCVPRATKPEAGTAVLPAAGSGKSAASADVEDSFVGDFGAYKMVIVARNDLKMGKGKIAAQCSHAAVGSYKRLAKHNPALLKSWEACGQPKVVVKVESEAALYQLMSEASGLGLTTCIIRDAGRTQIAPGSTTVLAVGPGPAEIVDKVTGQLKLL